MTSQNQQRFWGKTKLFTSPYILSLSSSFHPFSPPHSPYSSTVLHTNWSTSSFLPSSSIVLLLMHYSIVLIILNIISSHRYGTRSRIMPYFSHGYWQAQAASNWFFCSCHRCLFNVYNLHNFIFDSVNKREGCFCSVPFSIKNKYLTDWSEKYIDKCLLDNLDTKKVFASCMWHAQIGAHRRRTVIFRLRRLFLCQRCDLFLLSRNCISPTVLVIFRILY